MRNIIVVWLAIMMLAGGMIGVANPSQAAPETRAHTI